MAKYDVERAVTDIITYLQANLNAQIDAVSADKGDGISLPNIDAAAYFIHTMDERMVSYDPFIFIGINEPSSSGEGPMTRKTYPIDVVIVLGEKSDGLMPIRMLRYQRALEELFESGYNKICIGHKLKVQSMVPVMFKLLNSDNLCRAIGLTAEFNLG